MALQGPVLITGGAGFLGTALTRALVDRGVPVRLLDAEFDRNAFGLAGLKARPEVEPFVGDVRDRETVRRACAGMRVVVHLAARVGVRHVVARPLETMEVNLTGTYRVLEGLAADGVERFVFFSTSEVYGSHAWNVRESDACVLEPPDDPRWSYAASKVAGEHLVQTFHRAYGLPTVILRPFNVFGPYQMRAGAALRFVRQAITGHPITVYNDGSSLRAWCYVDDFVDGVLRAIEQESAVGEIFNLGNPRNAVTTYQLAHEVLRVTGANVPIRFEPTDHADVQIRVPNVEKARRLLGFRPTVELAEGLRRTAEWFTAHAAALDELDQTR